MDSGHGATVGDNRKKNIKSCLQATRSCNESVECLIAMGMRIEGFGT